MNKKLIYILIVSICISLLGMIIVQFFWIRNAFRVKDEMFSRSVNEALNCVVENLETRENMYFISRNFEGDSILQIVKAFSQDTTINLKKRFDSLMAVNELGGEPSVVERPGQSSTRPRYLTETGPAPFRYSYQFREFPPGMFTDSISISINQVMDPFPLMEINGVRFAWEDQLEKLDSIIEVEQEREKLLRNQMMIVQGGQEPPRTGRNAKPNDRGYHSNPRKPGVVRDYPPDRPGFASRFKRQSREDHIIKLERKARKIEEVIKQMAVALETRPEPVHQRINKSTLESSLSKSLHDKGIELPFDFAVILPSSDSNTIPIRSAGFQPASQTNAYRVSLFPNDLFYKPDLLMVQFEGQKQHVLKSMAMLLAGSFLFTLIIVISSAGSIVVMIRQKKISDIKTDFINNMTHEFKTPIATISIAADSINNPRVLSEPETIRNFTRIIKEENNRMNTRVEQVLQMALLDSRDFKLRPALVNVNKIIENVVEHYRLQIEKREGTIRTQLDAYNSEVLADEDHIRNVLLNLLDNANKYSLSHPEITIFSLNRSGQYFFGVQDKGMGMSSEVQRRVFDKFFRVTSGNIHNIKGFGLGLSYVKAIVLAHRGDIRIISEPGKGSLFEIGLPLVNRTIE